MLISNCGGTAFGTRLCNDIYQWPNDLWNWKKYNVEIYSENKTKGRKEKYEQKGHLVGDLPCCHVNYRFACATHPAPQKPCRDKPAQCSDTNRRNMKIPQSLPKAHYLKLEIEGPLYLPQKVSAASAQKHVSRNRLFRLRSKDSLCAGVYLT